MTGEVFEQWIASMFPKLPPKCCNRYGQRSLPQCVEAEKTLTPAWRKAHILAFLQEKGIAVEEGALKVELHIGKTHGICLTSPSCSISD